MSYNSDVTHTVQMADGSCHIACTICNTTCTSETNMQDHLAGAKHKKNLEAQQGKGQRNGGGDDFSGPRGVGGFLGPRGGGFAGPSGGGFQGPRGGAGPRFGGPGRGPRKLVSYIQDQIDSCEEPLLGLNFLNEYQDANNMEARFVCTLCESHMGLGVVIAHMLGIKHRKAYMKEMHMDKYTQLLHPKLKKSEVSSLADDFAQEIENEEGRGQVNVMLDTESITQQPEPKRPRMVGPAGMRPNEPAWQPEGDGIGPRGPPRFGGPNQSGLGSLKMLLSNLSSCVVNNEEDAAVALKVSNALTHALLAYRLRCMPEEARIKQAQALGPMSAQHQPDDFDMRNDGFNTRFDDNYSPPMMSREMPMMSREMPMMSREMPMMDGDQPPMMGRGRPRMGQLQSMMESGPSLMGRGPPMSMGRGQLGMGRGINMELGMGRGINMGGGYQRPGLLSSPNQFNGQEFF